MSNPIHAETSETGSRWYIHPKTGERFISVTTVLGNIAKFGLPDWSARLAAQAAMDNLKWLNRCAETDTCGLSGGDACGNCCTCAVTWLTNRHNEVRDAAADLGSKVHDAAEQDALFGEGATYDEDIAEFVDGYALWRDTWKPTFLATETTVISRKWGYAGTLDWLATFDEANLPKKFKHLAGLPIIGDTKTGKHLDVPKGWQVGAYAEADAILTPDGDEVELPQIGGGLILHIRRVEVRDGDQVTYQTKVQVREVHLSKDNFAYFVHTLRMTEGLSAGLNSVLSRPYTLKEA